MHTEDFSSLGYVDQLKVLRNSGRLKHSVITNGYQFSLFRVNNFYVELKRNLNELAFEKITAIDSEQLPAEYKRGKFHKEPW